MEPKADRDMSRASTNLSHHSQQDNSAAVSERLKHLLAELEREVQSLSSDNAALRREMGVARIVEKGAAARATTAHATERPVSSMQPNQIQPDKPADFPEVAAPLGLATPPARGLATPPAAGTRHSAPAKLAELAHAATRPDLFHSATRIRGAPQPSCTMAQLPAVYASGADDFLSECSSREVSGPVKRLWQQQYDRLRGDNELLSAYDLWVVVTRQEHKSYGHSKHPLRTVSRTVRLIRQAYGNMSEADESPRWVSCSCDSVSSPIFAACTPHHNDMALDWEAFMAFMKDENSCRISEEEGGNVEYLRKALRAESNEYMTEEARREIAKRQLEDVDPQPTGWRSLIMEQLPPPIIMLNAICMGLQSDMDGMVWEVLEGLELLFFAFYLLEISLKAQFLGLRRFFRGGEAPWNLFDLFCIFVSLTDLVFKALQLFMDSAREPNFLGILKFFRLARFARLARIIKSFKSHYFDDLKTMVLGILSGAKVLVWAVILFFACVFVLGVIMKELVGAREEEFKNVPAAMFSVFRCLAEDCSTYSGTPLHEKMREKFGASFMIPYILTFLVVNFGLFNLIVAVFIDRVVSISVKTKHQDLGRREREMRCAIEEMLVSLTRGYTQEREAQCRPVLSMDSVKGKRFRYSRAKQGEVNEERLSAVAETMQHLRAQRILITRELFTTWLTDPEVLELLESLEIDTATKSEIFDVCDVDKSGSLTCDEIVNGLMRLRGPISKCDVIAIRLKVRYLTKIMEDIHHMLGA